MPVHFVNSYSFQLGGAEHEKCQKICVEIEENQKLFANICLRYCDSCWLRAEGYLNQITCM